MNVKHPCLIQNTRPNISAFSLKIMLLYSKHLLNHMFYLLEFTDKILGTFGTCTVE